MLWKLILFSAALTTVIYVTNPPPYVVHIIINIFWFAYVTSSWNIVGGFAGQVSLGHPVFIGLGAYTSTLLFMNYGLSPWLGLFCGMAAALAAAALIGVPCFRFGIRGPYFAIGTLAYTMVMEQLAMAFREVTGGGFGITLRRIDSLLYFQSADPKVYLPIILSFWIVLIYIMHRLQKFRYRLLAIRENEDAAAALGVNVFRVKLYALLISAAFSAVGGTFYAQYYRYIDPATVFGPDLALEIMLIAIFGGIYDLFGPTIGSGILIPISECLRILLGGRYFGSYLIIYGIILILCVLRLPEGITAYLSKKR